MYFWFIFLYVWFDGHNNAIVQKWKWKIEIKKENEKLKRKSEKNQNQNQKTREKKRGKLGKTRERYTNHYSTWRVSWSSGQVRKNGKLTKN